MTPSISQKNVMTHLFRNRLNYVVTHPPPNDGTIRLNRDALLLTVLDNLFLLAEGVQLNLVHRRGRMSCTAKLLKVFYPEIRDANRAEFALVL